MIIDSLVARARRCAQLQAMLDEDPKHKDAPDWIAEISQKALSRKEDRHVAVVRSVRRIRDRIRLIEARAEKDDALKERVAALKARVDAMGANDRSRERFAKKLQALQDRLKNPPAELHRQKIPALERRLVELSNSTDLLTKEDLNDG